jgi:hypothetical protein
MCIRICDDKSFHSFKYCLVVKDVFFNLHGVKGFEPSHLHCKLVG